MNNPARQRRLTHKKRKADVAAKRKLKEGPPISELRAAHRRREESHISRGGMTAAVAAALSKFGGGGQYGSGLPILGKFEAGDTISLASMSRIPP